MTLSSLIDTAVALVTDPALAPLWGFALVAHIAAWLYNIFVRMGR